LRDEFLMWARHEGYETPFNQQGNDSIN